MKKISVSAFQIKMIALILMVFDHVREFFPDSPIWFNYLGRVSAPLFIFILVWSIDYTHDRRRFLLRLYIASIGMILVWNLMELIKNGYSGAYWNNIFPTLTVIAAIICLVEWNKKKGYGWGIIFLELLVWQGISIFVAIIFNDHMELLLMLTMNMFSCEGGFKFVALGLLLYWAKNNRRRLILSFGIYTFVYEVIMVTGVFARIMIRLDRFLEGTIFVILMALYTMVMGEPYHFTVVIPHQLYWGNYQWMMIGALPFMLLYNGQKGRNWKWFFYLFYPLHFVILFFLKHVV